MSPFIILPVIAGILIIGAVASAKGSVAQGDNKNSPRVPVPFMPMNNEGLVGWRYRGMYIAVHEYEEGGFEWHVYSGVDFSAPSLVDGGAREGVDDTEANALLDATRWIDAFRGGPLP
jgi:hypothetical protein